ncbi:MAG: hypothetical protein HY917_01050 [Candidatus Diapherotrites archaeon]|nr:hypothetical protein [Candidatus Diapherotrites archaeon]
MKYMKELLTRFQDRTLFSIRDIQTALKSKKISTPYLHSLLHHLQKKGKLTRITKGVYTFREDPVISGFAFTPFYYGLHHALSIHQLWSQASALVIITGKKIRSGTRPLMGENAVIRRINPAYLNGFEFISYYGKWIPVSTPEKTLIDFIYFRQKIPSEAKDRLLEKISIPTLNKYLKPMPSWTKKRVNKILLAHRISEETSVKDRKEIRHFLKKKKTGRETFKDPKKTRRKKTELDPEFIQQTMESIRDFKAGRVRQVR